MKVTLTRFDVLRYINPTLLSLAVAYPFVTHFLVVGEQVWPSLVLIYAMLSLLTLDALLRKHVVLLIPAVSGLVLATVFVDSGQVLLKFYPIIITGSLFAVFARTLLPGETPIITLFAIALEKQPSVRKIRYTKKITLLWCVMFLGLLLESILLAVYASPYTWSLLTNFVNYVVIGSVFTLEFIFRIYHFREEEQPGFFEFANQIRKLRISHVLQQKKS